MSAPAFLYSQLFVSLPPPDHDFTGQTVVITGANTGLGLEAARHMLKLNASHLILGVRNLSKGQSAKEELQESTGKATPIDIFHLDMEDYESVNAFAASVSSALPRVDVAILNAGKMSQEFYIAEKDESTITVNVVSTMLLALLLLPKLRASAQDGRPTPRLVIVASDRHVMTNLPEWKTPNTFDTLRAATDSRPDDRYYTSKLLAVLCMRELANKTASTSPKVVVNGLTPGYCLTHLVDGITGFWGWQLYMMKLSLARTAEQGSRTLVHAATLGLEAHGKYLNDCKIDDGALSSFVRSDEGNQAQQKVWAELMGKLDAIVPGVSASLS
ncbi:hypothetical protein ASPSYDRAFT_87075 [Aspergillus sydowii CBS 593.65]|uniref:Short-chain dehydrogenase/reductase family protein n=1 Tax=Aspergillus sydowii CBS 593.65 TaxID=1036612 RepID=A0A1L9TM31_9EURO|nr:uncharacterized protein ASPSYDRAFT_87075 [Aspergillus sydowii CBS 593.65]OJJ60487.1 hypothetical protein ASPSYDRAFT_87075 [Aspergillus sydowii CBS 593.65]